MKKTLGLAVLFALCGCASNPTSYQFGQEVDHQVAQIATLRAQYQQQINDHSFDPIRDRIALSGTYLTHGSPCTGQATETYPTEAEKAAIKHWSAQRNAFLTQLAVLAKPTPSAPERMARFMERYDQANFEAAGKITAKIDELSQGGLTYCQFARSVRTINGEAYKAGRGARATIDEEYLIDWKRRTGIIPTSLVYTQAGID
jgi:hypothetical protein